MIPISQNGARHRGIYVHFVGERLFQSHTILHITFLCTIGEYVNEEPCIMYIRYAFSSVLRHNNRNDDLLLCRILCSEHHR